MGAKKRQREHPTERVKSQYTVKVQREEGEQRREINLAAEVGEAGERERESTPRWRESA